ncbi:Ig-like domain repeat protein [Nocardioides sp. SYSU DS0663]|uniref:Ig-like domain repeat protein n=1 Tax=Nocardioides sp. SYSU DS0663 TaxID=3416445 RepID=UPI003F4C5115
MTTGSRAPWRRRLRTRTTMLVVGAVLATSTATGVVALAAGGLAPPAVDPALLYRPTAAPDRIALTPTADPATSQHLSWRSSPEAGAPRVQLAAPSAGVVEPERTVTGTTETRTADLGYVMAEHRATVDGLQPGTTYLYRVGDGETWSEWSEFTTAEESFEDFSFVTYGDAQNDVKSYVSRAFREATEARPYAKVALHVGDLTDTDVSDAEWGQWYDAAGFAMRSMNLVATPGNHEYYPGPGLTPYWRNFGYPDNGPQASDRVEGLLRGSVWSTDYQGVRFISLNSNHPHDTEVMAAQTAWLEQRLTDNPNRWTVVTFHHPLFSVASGRDNATIRNAWLPLLEEHDVDLVLQGHDHTYGRGNLFANEQDLPAGASAEDSHRGPVYLVSVAGPKYYVADPPESNNWVANDAHLRAMVEETQMYQLVDVTDDELHVESWNVSGELIDGFTISKAGGEKLVTTDLQPRASGPGSERADLDRPALPEPVVPGQEGPTDPGPTDPGPTDPGPTDPEPTDPEPTDPEPTDPEPTDPEPTDPEPTDPEPTDPEPTTVVPAITVDRAARQTWGDRRTVRVTATVGAVDGAAPRGSIVFRDGSRVLREVDLSASGRARMRLPRRLPAGAHQLTAAYRPAAGEDAFAPGRSEPITVRVLEADSRTMLRGLPKRLAAGARPVVRVRVKVRGTKAPAARVVVRDGKRVVLTERLDADGRLALRLPALDRGLHRISVTYAGTDDVEASRSATRKVRVR